MTRGIGAIRGGEEEDDAEPAGVETTEGCGLSTVAIGVCGEEEEGGGRFGVCWVFVGGIVVGLDVREEETPEGESKLKSQDSTARWKFTGGYPSHVIICGRYVLYCSRAIGTIHSCVVAAVARQVDPASHFAPSSTLNPSTIYTYIHPSTPITLIISKNLPLHGSLI